MSSNDSKILNYDRPANCFNEALPIGNGRIGAMVYGNGGHERLSLNDDTLWAGKSPPKPRKAAAQALPKIRELLFADRRHEAEELTAKSFQTEFTQPYLPAGNLHIDWPSDMDMSGYQRELSLEEAVVKVIHGSADAGLSRQYLASATDQVIAIHASGQALAEAPIKLSLSSALNCSIQVERNRLILRGRAPSAVLWEDVEMSTTETFQAQYDESSRQFAIVLDVQSSSGQVVASESSIEVMGAKDLTLCLALATDAHDADPVSHCYKQLDKSCKEFQSLRRKHVVDYRSYFHKVSLDLGGDDLPSAMTIPQRLSNFAATGDDPNLMVLLFNYSRYLMISASRAGTMPSTLQGIWNECVMPPWWSNYTVNINTQMNYWMAEACGLGDCHTALCDFVETLSVAGRQTAKDQFGCNGWVVNHQTDYRRQTTPVGFATRLPTSNSSKWSMWPMGGAWLSLHLFQHYQFGGDLNRLRDQAYPVMKGAVEFLLDWLIDDPRHPGSVTTAPSTSPENSYLAEDHQPCAISTGTTMDLAIARELFNAFVCASQKIGSPDPSFVSKVKTMLNRLPPTPISVDGRILEFDADWPEAEHPHRHISQLFALSPGSQICPDETPDLANAARKVLHQRGITGTGWSLVWKALCWARLGDGQKGYDHLSSLLNPVDPDVTEMADVGGGIYPNLLTACPPFQIDANFGFGSALLEMLLQDHRDMIRILPALPKQWLNGSIAGLHLRHGMILSMTWKMGRLVHAVVTSETDRERKVLYGNMGFSVCFKAGAQTDLMKFINAEEVGAA